MCCGLSGIDPNVFEALLQSDMTCLLDHIEALLRRVRVILKVLQSYLAFAPCVQQNDVGGGLGEEDTPGERATAKGDSCEYGEGMMSSKTYAAFRASKNVEF